MSQFEFCRSANRGDCVQPCRREYELSNDFIYRVLSGVVPAGEHHHHIEIRKQDELALALAAFYAGIYG